MTANAERAAADAALRELFSTTIAQLSPRTPTEAAIADLDLPDPIVVLALGKAARPMAQAALGLGQRVARAVVVAPDAEPVEGAGPSWSWLRGTHPIPDAASEQAGRALLAAAAAADPAGSVLALVSGGGSAMAAVPAEGLSLSDKVQTSRLLMAAGVPIDQLNCVRRHLSAIKGGRLAARSPAPVTSLIISDVIGDALFEIASGPTVPDPTSYDDACQVIANSIGLDAVPAAVSRHLSSPPAARRSAPRTGDRHILVSGMTALVDTAESVAGSMDLRGQIRAESALRSGSVGEVAAEIIERLHGGLEPGLWLLGGETTVSLPASPGVGGRAQQLALQLARALDGVHGITVLVAGSDGIDGSSQAAGAIVDGTSWAALAGAGVDGETRLRTCDAATALAAIDAQIVTGPTGVNHADLIAVYRWA